MKSTGSLIIIALVFALLGCSGNSRKENTGNSGINDTVSVADTGYTGIKQFMSGKYKVSEVTFRNGVKEGLTKTFYQSGKLQRTFWYVNGLRQDSSCWYYQEGQLFRTTPYRNDTIEGIQKQYYRTGELKAKIGYSKGFRTLFFEEYTRDGKLVNDYPDLVVKTEDNYRKNGTYGIILELTNKNTKVNFLKGDIDNGIYDTARMEKIKTVQNTGYINLKKTGSPKPASIGVVAEILTNYGNRKLVYRKIDLPYKDLD
jgi:hypothetical protein